MRGHVAEGADDGRRLGDRFARSRTPGGATAATPSFDGGFEWTGEEMEILRNSPPDPLAFS